MFLPKETTNKKAMTNAKINIIEGQLEEGQLVFIQNVNAYYPIKKVTEKAFLLSSDDGKWTGDGTIDIWVPKSQVSFCGVNDNPENSSKGFHIITLPDWFINSNSKKW